MRILYLKDLSFIGRTILYNGVFGNLVRRIGSGQIRLLMAATYAPEDIAEAQAAFQAKRHIGKIVLKI